MAQVSETVGLDPDLLPSGLDRKERAARAEKAPDKRFISEQSGSSTVARLWDTIDEAWTSPLPRESLQVYHLRKVVWRCSACTFSSIYDGSVEKHVPAVLAKSKEHEDAEIRESTSERGEYRLRCSRCDATFSRYPDGQQHLSDIIEKTVPLSNGVTARLQHRFAWSPSEPFLLQEVSVNGTVISADRTDEGTQAERSQRRTGDSNRPSGGRRRRRRRRR